LLGQLPHRLLVEVVAFEQGPLPWAECLHRPVDGIQPALSLAGALFDEVLPGLDLPLEAFDPLRGEAFVVERGLQVLVASLAQILVRLLVAHAQHVGRQLVRHLGQGLRCQLFQQDKPGILQNVFGIISRYPEMMRQQVHH